jgi:hypothetical protein
MKNLILVLPLLLVAATSTAQMPASDCDGFRRKVSTLTDADTQFLTNYEYTTVTGLTQLPLFTPTDTTPRQEAERHIYMVEARILAFKRQQNGDIYLVLRDPYSGADSTLTAIIPNPECPDVSESSQWSRYRNAFQEVIWTYGEPDTTLRSVEQLWSPLTITGIPFYNEPHHDTEQAANNLELHPVLNVEFLRDTAVDEGSSLPLKMNLSQNDD